MKKALKRYYNSHDLPDITQAERIVFSIIDDITDRKGLSDEWDAIEDGIKSEIISTHIEIVNKLL